MIPRHRVMDRSRMASYVCSHLECLYWYHKELKRNRLVGPRTHKQEPMLKVSKLSTIICTAAKLC